MPLGEICSRVMGRREKRVYDTLVLPCYSPSFSIGQRRPWAAKIHVGQIIHVPTWLVASGFEITVSR